MSSEQNKLFRDHHSDTRSGINRPREYRSSESGIGSIDSIELSPCRPSASSLSVGDDSIQKKFEKVECAEAPGDPALPQDSAGVGKILGDPLGGGSLKWVAQRNLESKFNESALLNSTSASSALSVSAGEEARLLATNASISCLDSSDRASDTELRQPGLERTGGLNRTSLHDAFELSSSLEEDKEEDNNKLLPNAVSTPQTSRSQDFEDLFDQLDEISLLDEGDFSFESEQEEASGIKNKRKSGECENGLQRESDDENLSAPPAEKLCAQTSAQTHAKDHPEIASTANRKDEDLPPCKLFKCGLCTDCYKQPMARDQMREHLKTHRDQVCEESKTWTWACVKSFKCKNCNKSCQNKAAFTSHLQKHMEVVKKPSNTDECNNELC